MKTNHTIEIDFIKTLLAKGYDRKDILQQFTKTYKKCSVKTFDNRLKVAKGQIQAELSNISKKMNEGITKDLEARKANILSVIERQEILSKIARGEIPLKKAMVCDGMIQEVEVVPDWMDRKNAIAELNKMEGDYAPTKTDINITKEQPLLPNE